MNENSPIEILAFVVGLYLAILFLLSLLGGWLALSGKYVRTGRLPANRKRFQSLGMGYTRLFPVSYGSVVHLGVDQSAVYFSIFSIFRPFHPPLKIPFAQLSGREQPFLQQRFVELKTKASARQRIWLSKSLAEWLEAGSDGAWTFERS